MMSGNTADSTTLSGFLDRIEQAPLPRAPWTGLWFTVKITASPRFKGTTHASLCRHDGRAKARESVQCASWHARSQEVRSVSMKAL